MVAQTHLNVTLYVHLPILLKINLILVFSQHDNYVYIEPR